MSLKFHLEHGRPVLGTLSYKLLILLMIDKLHDWFGLLSCLRALSTSSLHIAICNKLFPLYCDHKMMLTSGGHDDDVLNFVLAVPVPAVGKFNMKRFDMLFMSNVVFKPLTKLRFFPFGFSPISQDGFGMFSYTAFSSGLERKLLVGCFMKTLFCLHDKVCSVV